MNRTDGMPIHPTLSHPITGEPLFASWVSPRGRVYWPILGASEPPEGGDGTPAGGDGDGPASGRPYTPPASQEEMDRLINRAVGRVHGQYNGMTPEQARARFERADAMDALELEMSSDMDKAARAAADQGFSAAMAQSVPRIVRAEFRAEAKGVLSDEQLDAVLEDVDLTRYANDDGEPDLEKIKAKIAKIAPAGDGRTVVPGQGPYRTLGQGARPPSVAQPGERGRAEAQKRFGDRAKAPA